MEKMALTARPHVDVSQRTKQKRTATTVRMEGNARGEKGKRPADRAAPLVGAGARTAAEARRWATQRKGEWAEMVTKAQSGYSILFLLFPISFSPFLNSI